MTLRAGSSPLVSLKSPSERWRSSRPNTPVRLATHGDYVFIRGFSERYPIAHLQDKDRYEIGIILNLELNRRELSYLEHHGVRVKPTNYKVYPQRDRATREADMAVIRYVHERRPRDGWGTFEFSPVIQELRKKEGSEAPPVEGLGSHMGKGEYQQLKQHISFKLKAVRAKKKRRNLLLFE